MRCSCHSIFCFVCQWIQSTLISFPTQIHVNDFVVCIASRRSMFTCAHWPSTSLLLLLSHSGVLVLCAISPFNINATTASLDPYFTVWNLVGVCACDGFWALRFLYRRINLLPKINDNNHNLWPTPTSHRIIRIYTNDVKTQNRANWLTASSIMWHKVGATWKLHAKNWPKRRSINRKPERYCVWPTTFSKWKNRRNEIARGTWADRKQSKR